MMAQSNANEMPFCKEAPSAPPIDQIGYVSGYEGATFTPVAMPPPSYSEATNESNATFRRQVPLFSSLGEEEVRSALDDFVGDNCCYGKDPAKLMVIRDIAMKSAFHYKLETFTEKRETAWIYEPYKGQPIMSAGSAPPPSPWDVFVPNDAPFQNCKKSMEIPQTAYVKPCYKCIGNGRIRCRHCDGHGGGRCSSCNNGRRGDGETCTWCNGSGRKRCTWCHGHGQVRCNCCKGHGNLKYFIQLTVIWQNHEDDYVGEQGVIPEGLIKQVTGNVAIDERQPRVFPLTNFPDQSIVDASRSLVNKHSTAFRTERIIEQRHNLRIVPVAQAAFSYKRKEGIFHVYGLEHRVYFPDYPSKCCGCCTLM